jgi:hypothetical protein
MRCASSLYDSISGRSCRAVATMSGAWVVSVVILVVLLVNTYRSRGLAVDQRQESF